MKRKLFFMVIVVATLFACNDNELIESESTDAQIDETLAVADSAPMRVSSVFVENANYFKNGYYRSHKKFGSNPACLEYGQYDSGNHKFAIAQNVRGADAKGLTGVQYVYGHQPLGGTLNYHHMQVWCDKSIGGPTDCLPYPKIKCYPFQADILKKKYVLDNGKRLNQIKKINCKVHARVPAFQAYKQNWGWPLNVRTHVPDRQFNLAFDIYFDKVGQSVTTNYAAVMIWLTWEGNMGPAGSYIGTRKVDGVYYDVRAARKFADCDYQISYCRTSKSARVDNVNVLAVLQDVNKMKWQGVNISDKILSNINIGFEIFNAKGIDANKFFAIDQYNMDMQ